MGLGQCWDLSSRRVPSSVELCLQPHTTLWRFWWIEPHETLVSAASVLIVECQLDSLARSGSYPSHLLKLLSLRSQVKVLGESFWELLTEEHPLWASLIDSSSLDLIRLVQLSVSEACSHVVPKHVMTKCHPACVITGQQCLVDIRSQHRRVQSLVHLHLGEGTTLMRLWWCLFLSLLLAASVGWVDTSVRGLGIHSFVESGWVIDQCVKIELQHFWTRVRQSRLSILMDLVHQGVALSYQRVLERFWICISIEALFKALCFIVFLEVCHFCNSCDGSKWVLVQYIPTDVVCCLFLLELLFFNSIHKVDLFILLVMELVPEYLCD